MMLRDSSAGVEGDLRLDRRDCRLRQRKPPSEVAVLERHQPAAAAAATAAAAAPVDPRALEVKLLVEAARAVEERLHRGKVDRLTVHGDRVAAVEAAEQRLRVRDEVRIVGGQHSEELRLLVGAERLDQVGVVGGEEEEAAGAPSEKLPTIASTTSSASPPRVRHCGAGGSDGAGENNGGVAAAVLRRARRLQRRAAAASARHVGRRRSRGGVVGGRR